MKMKDKKGWAGGVIEELEISMGQGCPTLSFQTLSLPVFLVVWYLRLNLNQSPFSKIHKTGLFI